MAMGGHPSAPIIPAILALAETAGARSREVLEAIVVGVEAECRLGALIGAQHYVIGFHSTGTIGTFGAAAAGRAASNGLFSALAARGGYTSNPEILETEQGFFATHAGAKPSDEALDGLAGKFLIRDNPFDDAARHRSESLPQA
jgi:2-methylcitrate dehydratase PrpD